MNKIVNLRSAKYLVRRYEKFLKMEIPEGVRFVEYLTLKTGFYSNCLLCKEVKRKENVLFCGSCIWMLEPRNSMFPCANNNYRNMFKATHEEGKKLLTERIAMLKELIKEAESKKWKK